MAYSQYRKNYIYIYQASLYSRLFHMCCTQHKTYIYEKNNENIHLIFPQPTFTNCLFHQCVVAMNFQPFTHFLVFRIVDETIKLFQIVSFFKLSLISRLQELEGRKKKKHEKEMTCLSFLYHIDPGSSYFLNKIKKSFAKHCNSRNSFFFFLFLYIHSTAI